MSGSGLLQPWRAIICARLEDMALRMVGTRSQTGEGMQQPKACGKKQKRAGRNLPASRRKNFLCSEEPEIDFHGGVDRHWRTVLLAWGELPLLHGFDGLFIKAQTDTFYDFDVLSFAVDVNDELEEHRAGVLGFSGFFGILGIY